MSNVYRLRQEPPQPTGIIPCATAIHREVLSGRVTGLAYVAYLDNQEYIVHSCGEANDNIPLTRGMLLDLIDKLRAQA